MRGGGAGQDAKESLPVRGHRSSSLLSACRRGGPLSARAARCGRRAMYYALLSRSCPLVLHPSLGIFCGDRVW